MLTNPRRSGSGESPERTHRLTTNRSDSDLRGSQLRGIASSAAWRRERLLNIGNNPVSPPSHDVSSSSETAALSSSTPNLTSYGTVPTSRRPKGRRFRRNIPSLPTIDTQPNSRVSTPLWTPRRQSLFNRSRTKTVSLYDAPPTAYGDTGHDYFEGSKLLETKLNGIRVWYSSFTSVDWLHDAVKVCEPPLIM